MSDNPLIPKHISNAKGTNKQRRECDTEYTYNIYRTRWLKSLSGWFGIRGTTIHNVMIIAKSITQSEMSQVSHARLHSKLPDRPKCRAPRC